MGSQLNAITSPCARSFCVAPNHVRLMMNKRSQSCKQRYGFITSALGGPFKKSTPIPDAVDSQQEVDIERLINCVQELQDKIERLEGEVAVGERRDRDRMVAIRSIIKQTLATGGVALSDGGDSIIKQLEEAQTATDSMDKKWDSARNSFTLLMSKGYLQTTEQLRDTLLATEWEIGLRPIALQMGVTRFETYCAQNKAPISFETISALYEDPSDLSIIDDVFLRMQARACISAAEAEQRLMCFQWCTAEAQKLSQQFSEGEFLSKLLPDPIEQGVTDAMRKIIMPLTRLLGGGK